jgi:branched-chain amino acid aminotransferase
MHINSGSENQFVWLNGSIVAEGEARISTLDRGFLYGDGVFETIRAGNGVPFFLEEHIARLKRGLDMLRIQIVKGIAWGDEISALLEANDLRKVTARVRIHVSRGSASRKGLPVAENPTMLITVETYFPPTEEVYRTGWTLFPVHEVQASSLGIIKSSNYLPYLFAQQIALDAGADDAIIFDAAGNLMETSTASLLIRSGDTWWFPQSGKQLAGITREAVIGILRRQGADVAPCQAKLGAILSAKHVYALNSLIGMMPVNGVAGNKLVVDCETSAGFNRLLFRTNRNP